MEKHLFGLDGLRFLAAMAVVGFHFLFRGEAAGDLPQMPLPDMLRSAAAYGYLGVSIFFIISGFVILYSAEGRTPLEFFVSRFVRIYPTFIVMMTITTLVVVIAANPRFEVSPGQYGANLMVFSLLLGEPFVDGAYWSIVLELVFYGWIFLLLVIKRLDDIETIAFGWLALSLANEAFFQVRLLQDALITEYSGFFVAGIALQRLGKGVTPTRLALLVLSLSYGVFTSLRAASWFEAEYGSALSRPVIAAAVLGGAALFVLIARANLPRRFWGPLKLVGGVTYPLYLIHQHVGYVTIPPLAALVHPGVAILVAVFGLLAFSLAFHTLVERSALPVLRARLYRLLQPFAPALDRRPS
ncbi:acyltransferase [Ciceribacter sp. RN22]|uniref:acyltransferase family protein n=1 Tax=Ciceribacter sp. RN22 TaxID=2954932 RepID=UPI002092A541|nr:acyltransferase [Ciceribacter sp. RN22]MCO6177460.1 acyltransferase [Ciceribacter sp. RN22]